MRMLKLNDQSSLRIQEMKRIAMDADILIHQLNDTLRQSKKSSLASNRRIKQNLLQRRVVETSLKKGDRDSKLLSAAQGRLNHLQKLTRTCISAQEADRKSVSLVLQDEIAQGLLGIHVRLLALKKAIEVSSENLLGEIGSAQNLVNESTRSGNRIAHDRGKKGKLKRVV